MATTDSMELKWFIYVPQFSLISLSENSEIPQLWWNVLSAPFEQGLVWEGEEEGL